jgi:uncharacterized protein YbjT (DUF2867 family)
MQVGLTGATGFIGSHILTELREHGHEVIVLVRDDAQAEVLLLDQGTVAAKARAELGWHPSHPGLVEEFLHGGYAREVPAG